MSSGLAGVIAGSTSICTVGKEGLGLNYRGYTIQELAEQCSCFEEVAFLLIYGKLPNTSELSQYITRLSRFRYLPPPIKSILEMIPATAHPMDVLKVVCSVLGTYEPETDAQEQINTMKRQKQESTTTAAGEDDDREDDTYSQYRVADRLMALFGPAFLWWHHYHKSGIRIDTMTDPTDTIAKNFVKLLNYDPNRPAAHQEEPDELIVKVVDVSLILYAEHEFAASTFAIRTTISTLSDMYSGVCTAIGTLKGPLHGGANEAAFKLISEFASPDEAERGILKKLSEKQLIMGFGHRVYKQGDPRSPIIKEWARKLSENKKYGKPELFAIAERIDQVMFREKKMHTNLDFYSSIAYHMCGIPTEFFTPVFVISRTSGWVAHAIEQRQNNRLVRPNAEYTGPDTRKFLPISSRL